MNSILAAIMLFVIPVIFSLVSLFIRVWIYYGQMPLENNPSPKDLTFPLHLNITNALFELSLISLFGSLFFILFKLLTPKFIQYKWSFLFCILISWLVFLVILLSPIGFWYFD